MRHAWTRTPAVTAQRMRGEIEFRDVTFAYEGHEPILEQYLASRFRPGQTVAIVGQTGAGKTSLAKLVNRTYDVTAGQVLVDGVDVRDWNLEALRRANFDHRAGYLPVLALDRREYRLWQSQTRASEEIEAAAQAAQAHEFISIV